MSDTTNIAVSVQNLTLAYGQDVVLWDLSFELPVGNLIGIIGPNGAGKSTLLKAMMGLIPPYSGEVRMLGKAHKSLSGQVAYVPQRESVDWDFPASVEEVVMMGRYGRLGLFKRPGRKDRELVEEALNAVEMLPYRKQQIGALSGGQQQRVFVARALAQEASLYLMDEPFAGVDARSETLIFTLLRELTKKGKTLVIVFHNLHTAAKHFDWLVLVNKKLMAVGPTSSVFNTQNLQATYGTELPVIASVH